MRGNIKEKGIVSIIVIFLLLVSLGLLVYLVQNKTNFFSLALNEESASAASPYREVGWDPGIFRKCAKSAPPGALVVPYSISTDCDSSGNVWQIGFRSENSYNSAGCNNFDISSATTPIKLDWSKRVDNGYIASITTDFVGKTHPCGANFFNWLVFMDQNPFVLYPKPNNLVTSYKLKYDSQLPQGDLGGGSRVIVGWQGFWDGKAREIELSVFLEGWGDANSDPRIVATLNDPSLEYVHAYGGPYDLLLTKGQDKDLFVNWSSIINNLISGGYLSRPSDWNNTATAGVWAGVESNNKTATQAISSKLDISDFRIMDVSLPAVTSTPIPTVAPTQPPAGGGSEPDILTHVSCLGNNAAVLVEWARAPFAAEYDLYRGNSIIATRTDNAFRDEQVTNNVVYNYKVVMRGSGQSQVTSTKSVLTPSCAPVKSLKLEARCNTLNPNIPSVRVFWERPDNFNNDLQNFTYLLQRKLISGTGRSYDFEVNPRAVDFEETRDDLGPNSTFQYEISLINSEKMKSPVVSQQVRTVNCPS